MGTPKFWFRGIIALIFALTILGIFTTKLTSQPKFCATCHEMSSAISSWQSATHDKIRCDSCHKLSPRDKGVMLFKHFSQQDQVTVSRKPIECQNCHRESRVITPSGDLKIPHQFHLEQNIPCSNCHPGAGHISSATTNSSTSIAKYPTQVMALCLRCHYQKQGPLSCKACHRVPPVTLPHFQPGWESNHGAEAFANLASCNSCHKYTLFLDKNRTNTEEEALSSPVLYCRDNAFCADCHRKRPAFHTEYFMFEHNRAVSNEDGCLVCHQWNFPLPVENLPDFYCQECHEYRGWVPYPYGDARHSRQPKEPGT